MRRDDGSCDRAVAVKSVRRVVLCGCVEFGNNSLFTGETNRNVFRQASRVQRMLGFKHDLVFWDICRMVANAYMVL